eukprot:7212307-Lingulodinium_polyedra.AAC.1
MAKGPVMTSAARRSSRCMAPTGPRTEPQLAGGAAACHALRSSGNVMLHCPGRVTASQTAWLHASVHAQAAAS